MRLVRLIPQIYDNYLKSLEPDEDVSIYRMSMGHSCFLKQQYRRKGVDKMMDAKTRRNFRTGTLIGDDMETAVAEYKGLKEHGKLFIQEEVSIFDGRVVGHLDICFYHNDGVLEVIDEKTVKSWNWKYIFGKDAYDKLGYIYQLIYYAHGLMEKYPELDIKKIVLFNLYWRKGDGELRELEIDYDKYKEQAMEYWENCFMLEDEKIQPGDIGSPIQSWECSYCSFAYQCPSPYIKKKRSK